MFNMSWIHVVWPHGSLVPYATRLNRRRLIKEQDYMEQDCTMYKVCKVFKLYKVKGVQSVLMCN